MSGVFGRAAVAGTTRGYVNDIELDERTDEDQENGKTFKRGEETKKKTHLLRRLSSVRSALRPDFGKLSGRFRKISCLKRGDDEDDVPFMDIPRHKSIDIGVGLARRMSLFIFTKRTTCVHPYHPYYPKTTTRKIYVFHEEK
uniref:Uncharacterized protein n=1 Tax=Pectinophora gossypiella TaxID=13191 RepID=A0A1E1WAA3_PECGO